MGAILGGASGLGAGADKGQLKWADGLVDVLKGLLVPDAKGRVVILVRLPCPIPLSCPALNSCR